MYPSLPHHYGTPWRVFSNLQAAETLVIPRATVVGPTDGAGWNAVNAYGIVITGIHYDFTAANGVGFVLNALDDNFVEGTTVTHPIWSSIATTANTARSNSINCWIPLSRGDAIGTPSRGASLAVALIAGTPAATSCLMVEGLHVGEDFGRYCNTGSPINGFISTQPS